MTEQAEEIMRVALKRIASYAPPEKLRRTAMRDYGLEPGDAVDMAYENVIAEAKAALKTAGRRKKHPTDAADGGEVRR